MFEAWKKFSLAVIRGYTNHNFEAWTVPCLYVAGKYLRIFAIKADQTSTGAEEVDTFDEVNPDAGQNEKLEDAARTLNKMFQICLGDRFVSISRNYSCRSNHVTDLHWKNRGNGESTTSSISCSRHTSNSIRYHYRRIF